ncbi:hypothetical protein Pcinc_017362 [Petrolisthes cinctipes]|uniref:Gag-pol polyprotein n=1 Tax=Petrolisthes cinctipes TaxID=88211 RepID=A0AAE1KPZ5_PETCI|nr:hypothetical protein Pcinc_017362 [Petrolisthes cinctipes]
MGSNRSFIAQQLVNLLDLRGKPTTASVGTVVGEMVGQATEEVNIKVSSVSMKKTQSIEIPRVIVVEKLPPSLPSVAETWANVDKWKQMRGTETPEWLTNVELLVGLDVSQALIQLEVRRGDNYEPFALNTVLGLTFLGPIGPRKWQTGLIGNYALNLEAWDPSSCWECNTLKNAEDAISAEDRRVLRMCETSVKKVEGHYELPIPFHLIDPNLSDNRNVMVKRLFRLRKRFLKEPELWTSYKEEMLCLGSNGYTERVYYSELRGKLGMTCYLLHHSVLNPNKPRKGRVVFDSAATYKTT